MIKINVLLENSAAISSMKASSGLSIAIHTNANHLLFDVRESKYNVKIGGFHFYDPAG